MTKLSSWEESRRFKPFRSKTVGFVKANIERNDIGKFSIKIANEYGGQELEINGNMVKDLEYLVSYIKDVTEKELNDNNTI